MNFLSLHSMKPLLSSVSFARCLSSGSSNVKVEPLKEKYALISMNKSPVNSINLEFATELIETLQNVEKEKVKGAVLTTGMKSVFCAGLDLQELNDPDENRLRSFWKSFQNLWLTLYGFKLPLVSAISGHAPAGGCMIATVTDYRVMVDNPKLTIGLNEAAFGLAAPFWLADSYKNVIGHRQAELGLMQATLHNVQNALRIGLVDELASSKEEAIDKCVAALDRFGKCKLEAVYWSKLQVRQPYIDRLLENKATDEQAFVDIVLSDRFQASVKAYLASLKKK